MYEFLLPDIGEGISEAELISWSVQPGEHVEEDQELATISTDKVNVELPSPRAGTVKELCWEPGDIIKGRGGVHAYRNERRRGSGR